MSYKQPTAEPIAIVGSSCRFTGSVSSPSELWSLLQDPTDLSRKVPPERFNIEGFYHPDGEYHGTTNSPKAYWLDQDHRVFDAAFFNITPKEAEAVDPQQRMLLEVVYEALESAGYTLQQYAGENVAVFAGIMTADYDTLSQRDDITASQYYATGNARSIISNRISYFFNFNGPSMTIDTACSSSLVALHQAVLSLRSGESVMACVTGANLMITPEQFIVESSLHMLSPTGHCRMWDADADGYARGEGVAALLLKPLSRALADGDRIEGIIRETGVNSDGRTKGITMPNPEAQARLIRDTYRKTGLDSRNQEDRCQYFEAHGTGTHAGDPREAAAIEDAFFGQYATQSAAIESQTKPTVEGSTGRQDDTDSSEVAAESEPPLLVGSVKTVIGHTEGAAGLAGVLKVVQAMRHGAVPPNLHLQRLNPSVEPFYSNLRIATEVLPWPAPQGGQPRRASVNSFGFGGTNSHAIVEQYNPDIHNAVARAFSPTLSLTPRIQTIRSEPDGPPIALPLLLSANSQKSLFAVAQSYRDLLARDDSLPHDKLAWHAYAHRTALPFKVAVSGSSTAELAQNLDSLLDKARQAPALGIRSRSRTADEARARILGIFTGQGAQWATMSRGLLLLPGGVYRDAIRSLDATLQSCPHPPPWTLERLILAAADDEAGGVDAAAVAQPLCTAVQIGLVDLLRSVGVGFHAVVGHSSGEIGAAYAAGRISARDAMLVSYYRGMYAHLAGGRDGRKGGMLAVGMSKHEAAELCAREEYGGRICVAASNAPSSVTLSGDLDVLHRVRDELVEQKRFARMLMVDTAYHSPHMDHPAAKYVETLKTSKVSPMKKGNGTIWVSSVYGAGEPGYKELGASYWKDNMVRPVLFHEAVTTALTECGPFDFAIEVGPHPALKGPATQTMKATSDGRIVPYSGLLDRKKEDGHAFSDFLGMMWTHLGPSSILLQNYIQGSSGSGPLEGLPSYPWDHSQVHYKESRISRQYHFRTHAPHELLGIRTRDDNQYELRWRNILRLDKVPWIAHHRFQGQALLPASAYCVMALDAARVVLAGRAASVVELEDMEFMSGIVIEPESEGVEVLFSLSIVQAPHQRGPQQSIEALFTITSAYADGNSPMKQNFAGRLRIVLGEPAPQALPSRAPDPVETLTVSTDGFYHMMSEIGLDYSGPFRAIETIDRRFNFSSAVLKKRHVQDTTQLSISPATLDSCFQSAFATLSSPGDGALWTSFLPKSIERVRFNLAICDSKPNDDAVLNVEAHLTNFKPLTKDSAANFSGDMCIFNEAGEMEIQVEGLIVASFAATKPENDYELYLTTVMDVDPEDEIISAQVLDLSAPSPMLVESCERVASFYLDKASRQSNHSPPPSPQLSSFSRDPLHSLRPVKSGGRWPGDTSEVLDIFIQDSPYAATLEFVRSLGENLPDALPGMLPTLIEEAHQLVGLQSHISRVAKQVAHRYPRMNILGLTDPELGLTRPILSALKNSFLSYTVGSAAEKALVDRLPMLDAQRKKIILDEADLDDKLEEDHVQSPQYDLALVSTSLVAKSQNTRAMLKKLRQRMKAGGFLVLVHVSRSSLKERIRRCAGFRPDPEDMFTPPDWPDVLDECGFGHAMKNSYQSFPPGFSLIVRQAESELKQHALQPLAYPGGAEFTSRLLIVGGKHEETARIATETCQRLSSRCADITVAQTLDDIDQTELASFSAAIFLNDLDEPVLSEMTESRLEILKSLIKPEMTILWITCGARFDNPEHAASFGFARTMLAETPSLVLRMLDLESLGDSSGVICDEFARLATSGDVAVQAKDGAVLWSHEPEVHIQGGSRLVPRVLPWTDANNRVNASRRVVSETVNTLERPVEIASSQSGDGSARYDARLDPVDPRLHEAVAERATVQVDYSSVDVLNLGWAYSAHICVGRNVDTGETLAVLSKSNSSIVAVPAACAKTIASPDYPGFLGLLLRYLTSLTIAENLRDKSVLLIEPDELFLECAEEVLSSQGSTLRICVVDGGKRAGGDPRTHLLHPNSSSREIRALFPPDGAYVFDFLPEGSRLSELLVDSLPDNCEYHSRYSLLTSDHLNTLEDASGVEHIWELGINLALQRTTASSGSSLPSLPLLAVPDLLDATQPTQPFQVLDWRKERNVQHVIKPLVETQLFRPYKTYVLAGLTRDLGHSLCRLLADHGARHIVLASRNPNRTPRWRDELGRRGVDVRIEALDVTSREDVLRFRDALAETMPPVAGVVNGAMVLEDRVFAQMTLDTLGRVMRPKTAGSRNLDEAFDSPDMEFFIMTSSFAAVGGHAGQSNYAAANMYMNGLATSRRRRGLPGSALNIGVIYGLGFLHRERDELYTGLEREGYPPVSERDIHHMFLEAVVAGRPNTHSAAAGAVEDITTGLRRYRVDDPSPLHWHRDPRFSHYTREDDENADNGDGNGAAAAGAENGAPGAVRQLLDAAPTAREAAAALTTAMARRLEGMLRLPPGGVGPDSAVAELGVDSLAAVEVRSWIWAAAGRDVAVMKILGARSIGLLCEEIAEAIVQSRTEGGDKQADSADSDADVSVVGGSATSPSSGGADSSARSVARSE